MLWPRLHGVLLSVLSTVIGIATMLHKAMLNRSYAARVEQTSHIVAISQTRQAQYIIFATFI